MIRKLFVTLLVMLTFSVWVWADDFDLINVNSGDVKSVTSEDSADFRASDVVLDQNSVLVLSDFKSVHIQHLVAKDGARIRLAANANGGDGGAGENGSNGSDARFFLGSIEGHIIIEARGGNGGDGLAGKNGRQGADGMDGRNGRTLFFGLIYIGDGDNGQPGLAGEDGQDGTNGGRGGDGGNIALFYREKTSDSKIMIDVNGGQGGKGGSGGIGGLGGNGGLGGRGIRRGLQGAMGLPGKSGKPGQSAMPGLPGEAVVYQLENNLFRCLFELDLLSYEQRLSDLDFSICSNLNESKEIKASITLASAVKKTTSPRDDSIVLLSADGYDGENSSDAHLTGSTPPPGAAGSAGGAMTILVHDVPDFVVLSARGGHGGNGARGAMGAKGADGQNGRDKTWFHKGSAGTDGQNGGDGGNGSDGGMGANGGHIRIVYILRPEAAYDSDWANHFDYDVSGGTGGKAGDAGFGGRGGQGGKGGKRSSGKFYANGANGIAGRDGHQGQDGVSGSDGTVEFFEADSYENWVVSEFQRWLDKAELRSK